MSTFPPIDHVLMAELERIFPHRCPDPKDSEREIWMKAGERRVVDFLKAHYGDQQDNLLNV